MRITIGKAIVATTEANETYRVNQNTIIQTATPMSVATGVKAKSAPAEVATPFPPLNLSQGGYTCPRTLDVAARIPNISGEFHSCGRPDAISIEIFTAPNPFNTSRANTG
jgi:hypothetical protein